jgi:hypothetical protein
MGGLRPGPLSHNPLSKLGLLQTPGPLGYDDAAVAIGRAVDPIDFDWLMRHRQLKTSPPLIESTELSGLHLQDRPVKGKRVWDKASIWRVGEAIVFRVTNLSVDGDGNARTYHPPTDASWNGFGLGLGRDSLANAVGVPGVTAYARSKDEKDWALTAGCQLFRDLHQARLLEPKAAAAAPPPAGKAPAPTPPAPDKLAEATDAKNKLDVIFKKYGVTKVSELETKSQSAVCVLYVEGRPPADSRKDWSHVQSWAGIQTNASGPIIRSSGPNKGFYIPASAPGWADAFKHPWVVLNDPEDQFGVNLMNNAVVIKNGDPPVPAFGMVADPGPRGHLGEVSRKMIDDLGFTGSPPSGDYIIVLFPGAATAAAEKSVETIRSDAKSAFEGWTWQGRSGLDLIKELFPTPDQYQQVRNDFSRADSYLTSYIDHMQLKL